MTVASTPVTVASTAMQARDDDLAELYDKAPCGYLTVLDDGTIVRVNDTMLTWIGVTRPDLLGTRLQALLPVGDRILYTTHCVPQLQMAGLVEETAIELVAADGNRRAALLTAARSPATEERPALIRVVVFSAQERRRYEQELLAALRRAAEADAERERAEAELQRLALHDVLTGLPNRRGLTQHVNELLEDTGGAGWAVLLLDLDGFKSVNDALGHAAGDVLLQVVADRLRSQLRGTALLARLSGDEFAVVDRLDGGAAAAGLAARLLEALAEPVVLDDLEIVVGASIGVVVAEEHDDDAEALLRAADIAMFRAKDRGRGCWQLHDARHPAAEVDHLRVLGELRRGIGRGELRLHYQPRFDLRTGRLQGVEALVRWQHPERGLLPPSEFIELAEGAGLIRQLGAWVLDEAVSQAARWAAWTVPGPPREMAVNLSARQLGDAGLVDLVAGTLERYGLAPQHLVLEITETSLLSDADTALTALTALKRLGVRLSVDDFGTGYSSLTYLKSFPVDELKLDRSFVAGVGRDDEDTAIVASCIQLGHALGLTVVAEGVETEQHRRVLLQLGCDLAQGYLLGRPVPPEDLQLPTG